MSVKETSSQFAGDEYDTAQLRQMIIESFSDDELMAFVFDHFQSTYEKFADGLKRTVKIHFLIEDCYRQGRIDELLQHLKKYRPSRAWRETIRFHKQEKDTVTTDNEKTTINIHISDIDLDKLSASQRDSLALAFQVALAGVLGLTESEVKIMDVKQGSVILEVNLSTHAVSELVKLKKDYLAQELGILSFDLSETNLSGADLSGANLRFSDLSGADLSGADLREAKLGGTDLRGANLRGADLRYTKLSGADLRDVNLRDVNLRISDLRGADLRGANLSGADLSRTTLSEGPITCFGGWMSLARWPVAIWANDNGQGVAALGCQTLTFTSAADLRSQTGELATRFATDPGMTARWLTEALRIVADWKVGA